MFPWWVCLPGYMPGSCGCGGKFVLLPKNLENVAAFSKFLCPPHLLGSNFPPHFCHYFRIFTRRAPKSVKSALHFHGFNALRFTEI